jgi:hypothetical protein
LPLLPAVGIVALALATGPAVRRAMFSGFQDYDDEGYLLIVLREYARGGRLYDEVYSQYGPAYHQVVASLFALAGLPFAHTSGRAIVVVLWLAATALLAALAYRLTRSLVLAMCAQAVAFQALAPLRDEPLHPGGWLVLVIAGVLLAAPDRPAGGARARRAAGLAGVLLGVAVLTKVNVGVFAIASAAFAFRGALPAPGRLIATAGFLGIPLALLGPAASHPDVRVYLALVVAATLGVVLVDRVPATDGERDGTMLLLLVAATVAAVVVLSCTVEWWRGTTCRGLIEGILLGPARHPGSFLEPPALHRWVAGHAALWLAGAALAARAGAHPRPVARSLRALGGPVRIAAGMAMWLAATGAVPAGPLAIAPPALWLALVPPPGVPAAPDRRRLLVATAALQALHAFPVGGSQVAFGTVFAVPVAAVLVADGWRATAAWLGAAAPGRARQATVVRGALGAALVASTLGGAALTARRFADEHERGVPLGLPGAGSVRVPAEQAALYRRLTASLRAHCATFVSQPGLNSLYFFAELEPPTRLNATAWMALFDDARQAAIVAGLDRLPGPLCAVRRQRAGRPWHTPLARFIDERFVTVYEQDYFEFRLPRHPGPGATVGAADPGPDGQARG